ncbi:MAG TPA: PAS domain-containing protein [Candidatus Dormibacteraeota bacterium]|nr:PAS domain-containing protein [Candidatus Dormibacteraeota bacterium]
MRALKQIREIPDRLDDSVEALLAQFSATTLELNPSVGAKEFARRLTSRAAAIFRARAAALVFPNGESWQIANLLDWSGPWDQLIQSRLASALGMQSETERSDVFSGSAADILGSDLSRLLGWRKLLLIRLARNEEAVLGVLCLADLERPLTPAEQQVLVALAAHASVAIENVRLFSRIELSRKQWVQDVDAISDYILVHDRAGRVLRLNRALADLLGTRPVETIGSDVGELNILGLASRSGHCPFCRNAASSREEFVLPAGNRTYVISSSRIHSDGEGEPRTVHVLKDITDRREAERRYRHERDFNRNILNSTQSMILVLDTAGLVSYANRRCFEWGYTEQNLLGHPIMEMIPPPRRPILAQAVERALAGETTDHLELPVLRGDHANGQFSISLSPMRDEGGEINSMVVVMTDVTDAASLQAKLMHTEKMAALGQLVSGVAHEVNNPLAAIVGFTDLLLENPAVPNESKQDLAVILQEAQRTRQIVQNLLSFARQMPAQREPVLLNSVVQQTLKLRSYDFLSHGVEVIENYSDQLPLAIGDPNELQQVFLNIMNNAYDAIQEVRRRGKIEIATSFSNGLVDVRFSDNGPGIQHPERIFDPFYTTKEVGKGTGLGLSICYGIINAHRGEIIAQNNPDGIGCTFRVRLPAATEPISALAAEGAAR